MIRRFCYDALPVSRWRNGGGETREIVSFPPGAADFAWRASIATLDASGPFSLFPGVDRVITLLQGDSPLLQSGGLSHRLQPCQPWRFAGEAPVQATVHGRCSDFNIMTRRDSWRAEVSILQQASQPGRHGVAYVLAGAWQYASGEILLQSQGIWWLDEALTLSPQSRDARLLWCRLSHVL
ncbi:HutD family protein [Pantoea sp. M_9]|uniref:HutD/Ves family protein n=1 Tax=Pantoea sp. M_9 TaxID=2608041 RepID=UPI001231A6E6|nr:HutD family protein [Pantoea sp. M_9]KAA5967038.1 HutD family protein [Pantoea sp. M_9]